MMDGSGEHRAYPWPPAAGRAAWWLLGVVVALGTAAAPAFEARFRAIFVVYVVAAAALAVALGGLGALLVARALGVL
ncbi:MAG: hypothetical protein K0A98_04460 [Trueperaceae bacterium]|nr:hypothetical protein [Trueperaceae bacterium]